ncbi:MAG: TlpA family protein disulfide reductase [Nitrospirae bacterium]|nr:MAG: TlpA family protein disulfide reductase [Nitrospirota bacterium]
MNRLLTLAFTSVVLLGLLGMAGRPPLVGGPAPEITLKDLQGQEVRLSDLRGKIVLLNFWATWCKPCKEEMPAMQASYDKLRGQGLVVLAVNELEDTEKVIEHVRKHGHTFPVVMDHDNHVANRYGVVGLPASFLVDRQGIVREQIMGSLLTEERIADLVRRYGDPAPPARH